MANINLANFKGPGITTLEIDATQEDRVFSNLSENRLLIGFSKVGPFNRVTRISDTTERLQIYGPIDTSLEKRGSFFHRSIDIALQTGPILALNLLPIDESENSTDTVDFRAFSTSPAAINPSKIKELYSSFFDREKFWKPSQDNLLSVVNTYVGASNSILSFVNLNQNNVSILIKKSKKQKQFDLSAKEYYNGTVNVPKYIDPDDNMSEFFVDVLIVKGDFSDYAALSTDPIYSKYFNANGLKKESVISFENSSDFELLLSVTGAIIPDVVDGTGISYSIDSIINAYTSRLGILASIDSDYLNSFESTDFKEFDMIGHSLCNPDDIVESVDFLSYKFNLLENLTYTQKSTFTTEQNLLANTSIKYENTIGTANEGLFSNRIRLNGTAVQANITANYSLIELNNNSKFATIKNYSTSSGNTIINYTHPDKESENIFQYNVVSANVSANTITIQNRHDDFSLNMANEYIYVTDGISKYYFEFLSSTYDSLNNRTTLTLTASSDIAQIDNTFKVKWSAGYKIKNTNVSANTITFKGIWNVADLSPSLTANVVYLKNNSNKIGNLTFSSGTIDSNGDTTVTVSSVLIQASNGATVNLVSLNNFSELTSDSWYITFGAYAITRPIINSGSANISYRPSVFDINSNVITAYKASNFYKDWESGVITSEDLYYKEITGATTVINPYYTGFEKTKDLNGIEVVKVKIYEDSNLTKNSTTSLVFGNKKRIDDNLYENVSSNEITFSSKVGNINKRILINTTFDGGKRIRISSSEADSLKIGDYIVSEVNTETETKYFLSQILTKKKLEISGTIYYDLTIPRPAKIIIDSGNYYVERYLKYDDFVTSYNLTALSGFNLNSYHLPGNFLNKQSQLEKIFGVIENTGLMDALTDKNVVDYLYIIDTFESTVQAETSPKDVLGRLAQKHGQCTAFINAPSIKEFMNSSAPGPIFTTFTNGSSARIFKPEYITTGGNLELSPDFFYSLPTDSNGSKYCAFFGPHLKYQKEDGQIINIPPVAHVSNIFVNKINSGNQYNIAAGVVSGAITDGSVVGLEYDFTEQDLGFFESFGYNAIINKRAYGIVLYGNYTAYQRRISPLNALHVRDNLNLIERDIELILERFLFQKNTQRTRFEIRDNIRELLFGLLGTAIESFSVTVENPNTSAFIDPTLGIVNVVVEPIVGLEKFLNIVTINKNSGTQTSGFNIV